MTTVEIKAELHEEIEHGDPRLLKMIYALIKEYREDDGEDIADERLQLVLRERERYLRGEGRSYTWAELKNMAISRNRPHEL
jgi:hypothetical protein